MKEVQTGIYISDGKYYKMVHQLTIGKESGMCVWAPMKKILWFYIRDKKKPKFILDPEGFNLIKGDKENE